MSGVGDSFARLVVDGPFVVAALVAAVAGLVSFLSPCVLPLVPGYLSYVGGLSGTEANAATDGTTAVGGVATRTRVRSRTVLGAMLFVLGFTAVFVTYGVLFGRLGAALIEHQRLLERILGVVVILLGLAFLGWLPGVSRELRIHRFPSAGLVGAPLLGIVFGLGWTPCLGPTLAAVNSLAYAEATAGRGAFLGVAYCLGLGIPFVLVALGARWAMGATSFLRRHARTVTRVGGAVLVVVGVLLVTGLWTDLMQWLRAWLASSGFGESAL